jgi:hypothetical protein
MSSAPVRTILAATRFPRRARMRCRPVAHVADSRSFEVPAPRTGRAEGPMLQSHVVEIDGVFVGAAVRQPEGYRFVAVDVRLDQIDGRVWPTLSDVCRHARATLLRGRAPALPPQALHFPQRPGLR